MPYQFPPDLQQMISARMAGGIYRSEDDVLRSALEALAERDDDLAAIQAAVEEWRAGDEGTPLSDAFEIVRNGSAPGSSP